jgi:hypothetical protein
MTDDQPANGPFAFYPDEPVRLAEIKAPTLDIRQLVSVSGK